MKPAYNYMDDHRPFISRRTKRLLRYLVFSLVLLLIVVFQS